MDHRVGCVLLLSVIAPALAAQSRSADLLAAARTHIAARQWDSADVDLSAALETAPYIMDSAWTYVWRGVLEYQQDRQQLAKVSFRRAFSLYPDPGIRGLDTISTGLAALFDREFRAQRTFSTWDLDQPARWTARPDFLYPRDVHPRQASGEGIVRMVVDTAGRVDERNIEILAIPDSVFSAPLKQMITGVAFKPARIGGKPVRSVVAYRVNIAPPSRDPLGLIELARTELRAGQADSALSLLEDAADPVNKATPAMRVYAELVKGLAWQVKGDRERAATTLDSAVRQYDQLRATGTDFAPFLRRLADSVRLTASRE